MDALPLRVPSWLVSKTRHRRCDPVLARRSIGRELAASLNDIW